MESKKEVEAWPVRSNATHSFLGTAFYIGHTFVVKAILNVYSQDQTDVVIAGILAAKTLDIVLEEDEYIKVKAK